jgi:hypothetical protein
MKGMGNHWAVGAFCVLALAACPTVDLGDSPPDIGLCNPSKGLQYFISDIEPKYFELPDAVNGCARDSSCHDQAHGLTLERIEPDDAVNYRVTQGYLNCGDPMASELLTKPLAGIDGHGGGDIFQTTSDARVVDFLAWFTQ